MREIKPFGTSQVLTPEDLGHGPAHAPKRITDKYGIIRENGHVVFVPWTKCYPDPVEIKVTDVGQLEPGDIIELITVEELLGEAQPVHEVFSVQTRRDGPVTRLHASELLFFKRKLFTVGSVHKAGSVIVPELEKEDNGGRVYDSRISSVTDSDGDTVHNMNQGLLYNTQTWYPGYRITAKMDFCYTIERIHPVPYHPDSRCFLQRSVPAAITDSWFLNGLIKSVRRVMYDNERLTALKEASEEVERQTRVCKGKIKGEQDGEPWL